jgi:hypothetical protein
MFVSQEINYSMCIFSTSQQVMPQVTLFIFSAMNPFIVKKKITFVEFYDTSSRGLSGHRAHRRVADSWGPVLVAGLFLNK